MRAVKPGEEHRPKDMRLRDLADAYVEYLTNPKTKVDTKAQLDWFIEYIGNVKVSQIEVHQVLAYLASKDTWSSKATALERITAAINWAIGVQRPDKAHRLEVPKMLRPKRKPRTTAMTPTQEAKLEDAASDELRSILTALRHTGCRPGEMCGATIDQFHQRSKILFVLNKTRHQTEIEYRPVYLGPEMLALLKSRIGSPKEGHIFLKANGTPWTQRYLSLVVWRTLDQNVAALQDRGHVLFFQPGAAEVHRKAGTRFDDREIYEWFAANLHRVREPSLRHYVRARELKAAGMDWTEVLADEGEYQRARLARELLANGAYASTAARVKASVEQGGGCWATFFNYRRYLLK
ncbi:MAG: tyrosine-type recombinase/integrase [Isosphaeraceae bacterium]